MVITTGMLQQYLGIVTPSATEHERLRQVIDAATAAVEHAAGRRLIPYRAALRHQGEGGAEAVPLRDTLIALESVSDGSGGAISDVSVLDGVLLEGALPCGPVMITGLWGSGAGWRSSLDVVNEALFADDREIAVIDAYAADAAGRVPRFSTGQLLMVSAELLRVNAVLSGERLAVERGVNGTIAAVHPLGSEILIYTPHAHVESLVLRWAGWLYRAADISDVAIPAGLLREAERLQRVRVN
jgi:hypothetical protein